MDQFISISRTIYLTIAEFRLWSQNASEVQNLALQFTNHVTLDKTLKHTVAQFPLL